MTDRQTDADGYIATDVHYRAIYGVGATSSEAVASAPDVPPGDPALRTIPATGTLIDYVREHGGSPDDVDWTIDEDGVARLDARRMDDADDADAPDDKDILDRIVDAGDLGHAIAATALDASMGNDPDPIDVVDRVAAEMFVARMPGTMHGAEDLYGFVGKHAVNRFNDRVAGDESADPRAVAFIAGMTGGGDHYAYYCSVDAWRRIVEAYELARRAVANVRGSVDLGDVVEDPFLSRSGVVDCRPGYSTGDGHFEDDLAGV